jgi:hypothetical protein
VEWDVMELENILTGERSLVCHHVSTTKEFGTAERYGQRMFRKMN